MLTVLMLRSGEFAVYPMFVALPVCRGGKVSLQSCGVTNQLYGKCRRHDHSREVRGHAHGKILQNYTYIRIFVHSGSKF